MTLAELTAPRFHRATDYLGAWAIEPTAGAALLEQFRRTDLRAHVAEAPPPKPQATANLVTAANGQQVAVVMLTGTLQKSVSSMSGGTSTVRARADIRKAAADPAASAILVAIDSPGGTVAGTMELANEVRRAAGQKPVWAFIDDLGASAAYWVASQADQVFANNKTAMVGSIGTLLVAYDLSGAADQAGIKALVFGTGPLKGTGAPGAPITAEQQDYLRGIVETAQQSFDAAVQKGRSLTDKQLSAAKTGGVFGAADALGMKLIDGIKSFDQTVNDLAAFAKRQTRASANRAESPVPVRSATMDETLNPTAGAVASASPAQAVNANVGVPDPVAQYRAAVAAEAERVAAIQQHCAGHPAILAQAVREGWTPEKAENQVLRAKLANNVQVITGATRFARGATGVNGVSLNAACEAGLMMSLGRRDVERLYSADVLTVAHDNFRGIGLQQLLFMAAVENGYAASAGQRINGGNIREVLRFAFPVGGPRADGGVSNMSVSGILSNVANKELLAGYMEDDQTWRAVAATKSVGDFKTITSYRLLDDMKYEKLAPDGSIKHGTADSENYTRQASTYAKMFALTRTDMINDDLGAFGDIRTRLGRGAARKLSDVCWSAYLNNASFFTSGRGNYISGSTTNLGTDGVGLGLGVKAFRTMKSPAADGSKAGVGARPTQLIVPPELEASAEAIYRNQNLGGGTTVANANIYANLYKPVVVWQLSDAGYTGNSATQWYLAGDPSYLPALVVSFLNGNESPTVEAADADFDQLAVQFRGYHDFGADLAEYLGTVKSKGAA